MSSSSVTGPPGVSETAVLAARPLGVAGGVSKWPANHGPRETPRCCGFSGLATLRCFRGGREASTGARTWAPALRGELPGGGMHRPLAQAFACYE